MNKFINTLKRLDPTLLVVVAIALAIGFLVGQYTTDSKTKKHYLVNASEVEVVYHDPYKNLTLDTCLTDYECNIADLLNKQAMGQIVDTDDPIFFPDSVPVNEPVDCETNGKACLKQNVNAGKPSHYPSICEPYIFNNPLDKTL